MSKRTARPNTGANKRNSNKAYQINPEHGAPLYLDMAKREQIKNIYRDIIKDKKIPLTDDVIDNIVKRAERSCWNLAIQNANNLGKSSSLSNVTFINLYSMENSRLFNLLTESDVLYLNLSKDNKLCNEIASKITEELVPDLFKAERDDIIFRQSQKVEQKTSDKYECKQCKSRCTTFIETQNRSADEAGTISIKCMVCQKVWRA